MLDYLTTVDLKHYLQFTQTNSTTMRALLLSALILHVAVGSRIHIYVSEDAPAPYSPEAILAGPMMVVFPSAASPHFYRLSLVPAGLKGDILKTDPAYQDLYQVLHSDSELSAVYADVSKFQNAKIFNIPLVAGDTLTVPSTFKLAGFVSPILPLVFITHPKDMQEFEIKNIKHVEYFDL